MSDAPILADPLYAGPEFQECESCAAKPGAPTLCAGCLANRATIARLRGRQPAQVPEDERESLPRNAVTLAVLVDERGGLTVTGGTPDPTADPRSESLPLGLKRVRERLRDEYPLEEMKAELGGAFKQALESADTEGLGSPHDDEAAGWADWAIGLFERTLIAGSLAETKAGSIWRQFRSLHAHLGEVEKKLEAALKREILC